MKIKSVLAAILAIALLPTFTTGCDSPETAQKGAAIMPEPRIPPIDTAAPVATETATFALG